MLPDANFTAVTERVDSVGGQDVTIAGGEMNVSVQACVIKLRLTFESRILYIIYCLSQPVASPLSTRHVSDG